MSGYVALHRKAKDHPLFKGDSARFGAWCWLFASACWKPTPFNVGGKMVTLQRGQFCTSVRELAEQWGWSKSSVDRFLTRLKTETMIGTDTGTGRLIITICNYDEYQGQDGETGTAGGTPTGTAAGQQRDIKEEGNKGIREEEEANASPSSSARPRKRARSAPSSKDDVPLPEGWEPVLTPAVQKIVDGWPPGMLERERMKFENHARMKGRLAKDWQAAFRTWIIKTEEQRDERSTQAGRGYSPASTGYDRRSGLAKALDADIARLERNEQLAREAGRRDPGDGRGLRTLADPSS